MIGEYICINGNFVNVSSCGEELKRLIATNYTYRDVLTAHHRPLHLDSQIELIELSCRTLFGTAPGLDTPAVDKLIGELLYRNRASQGGNIIRIIAVPDNDSGTIDTFIFYENPTVYNGYSLWHRQIKALPLTYEIPFPAFRTSANLTCHNYSREFARRQGCDCAIAINYDGVAVSLGEHPLFCIKDGAVYTPDATDTVPQSVERLLGIELCRLTGLPVHEKSLTIEEFSEVDEAFSFTTAGLLSIFPAEGRKLSSSVVKSMEKNLSSLGHFRPSF